MESRDPLGHLVLDENALAWKGGPLALAWGEVWGIRPAGDGKAASVCVWKPGGGWTSVGTLEGDVPFDFLPLGDDAFLAIVGAMFAKPYQKAGSASPFALFRRTGSGFRLERLVHLTSFPLLERYEEAGTAGEGGTKAVTWRHRPGLGAFCFQVEDGLLPVPLPKGGALISFHTGHVWLFSREGDQDHHLSVVAEIHEADFRNMVLWPSVILGAVPTPDGHVLIAARARETVLDALSRFPRGAFLPAEAMVGRFQDNAILDERVQAIEWYDLDPENGSLHPTDAVPANALHCLTPRDGERINWEGMRLFLNRDFLFRTPPSAPEEDGQGDAGSGRDPRERSPQPHHRVGAGADGPEQVRLSR